jgi:hypothetical protein
MLAEVAFELLQLKIDEPGGVKLEGFALRLQEGAGGAGQ